MDAAERLEWFDSIIEDLDQLALTHILLVEGKNDVLALHELGVEADMFCVQSGGGPVRASEYAWEKGRPAVILTDWDRRGDSLADDLRRNLSSLCVKYDDSIRDRLARVCGPFCRDVESVHLIRRMLEREAARLLPPRTDFGLNSAATTIYFLQIMSALINPESVCPGILGWKSGT